MTCSLCMVQVHNTPKGHVTRDYREGRGSLADLQFTAIDTSGAHLITFPYLPL